MSWTPSLQTVKWNNVSPDTLRREPKLWRVTWFRAVGAGIIFPSSSLSSKPFPYELWLVSPPLDFPLTDSDVPVGLRTRPLVRQEMLTKIQGNVRLRIYWYNECGQPGSISISRAKLFIRNGRLRLPIERILRAYRLLLVKSSFPIIFTSKNCKWNLIWGLFSTELLTT